MRFTSLLYLIFFLTSCEWSSSESANVGFAKTLTEDEVTERMINDLPIKEENQNDIDKTKIINHIIEHKLDMQSTPDGIYYQIIKEGKGSYPSLKDEIVVNYTGWILDGKIFDTTEGKKSFVHPLRKMNDGWQKIIPMMKTGGSKGLFIIPSKLCYGENGWGDLIPPNSVLKFEIELLGVKEQAK